MRSDDPEYRAGGPHWRAVSGAIYARLRGSIVDTIQLLQDSYGEGWQDYAPRPAGYVSWMGRQHATAYAEPPTIRYLNPDSPTRDPHGDEVVRLITSYRTEARIEEALEAAQEETVTCGNAVVWMMPVIRRDPELGTEVLTVEARAIPAYQQTVAMGERPGSLDECDVAAWQVELPVPGGTAAFGQFGLAEVTPTSAVWKSAPGEKLNGEPIWPRAQRPGVDGADGVVSPTNPLGEVPAVVLRWSVPRPGDFWSLSREELLWQARAIDKAYTDAGQIVNMQGFGQWKGRNLGAGGAKIKFGPGVIADLGTDPNASLENEAPKPDLAGGIASLEAYLRVAVASQDGNPASLIRSTAITAMGKQLEIADRDALRRRLLKLLARAEQRLYDLMRRWLRHLVGVDVLPPAILVIEYPPPVVPVDPLHEVQTNERLLALGQTNPYKLYARKERVSLEQARKDVDENIRLTKLILGQLPTPGTPAPAPVDAQPPGTDVPQ